MPKGKKEHKMSERKKYLRTLMAEMGLSSLDELSKEERRRWIRAAEPQKIVKKKLKEMGYSLNSDNNKRSLGRVSKIISLKKSAENTSGKDLDLLRSLLDKSTYQKVMPVVFPLFGVSGTFGEAKYIEDSLKAIREASPSEVDEEKITDILERLSKSIAKAIPVDLIKAFADDPNQSFDLSRLSERDRKDVVVGLTTLKYLSSQSNLNPSDEEIVVAIKAIQDAENLNASGLIDKSTYSAITAPRTNQPTPAPLSSDEVSTSLRGRRDQIRDRRRGSDETPVSSFDLSKIENINIGPRVDLDSSTNDLRQFVMILDKVSGDLGINPTITSAFRNSYNQARVMLNNYNRRGSGSRRARVYLETLYRNFPKMNDIINVYESGLSKEDKILKAESIIEESWPVGGHRAGKSIDIARESKSTFDDMLSRAEEYASFKRLWEKDHYHLTIKSIKLMPTEGIISRTLS